jgi:hypothetical protein
MTTTAGDALSQVLSRQRLKAIYLTLSAANSPPERTEDPCPRDPGRIQARASESNESASVAHTDYRSTPKRMAGMSSPQGTTRPCELFHYRIT